jgi:hypothetical protein
LGLFFFDTPQKRINTESGKIQAQNVNSNKESKAGIQIARMKKARIIPCLDDGID